MENELKKVNVTFETDDAGIAYIESFLRQYTLVVDFKIIPDTYDLYKSSDTFKGLVKKKKEITREIDLYINEYNFKNKNK